MTVKTEETFINGEKAGTKTPLFSSNVEVRIRGPFLDGMAPAKQRMSDNATVRQRIGTYDKHGFFESYVGGGIESANALTREKGRLDLLRRTRHHELCREDFRRFKEIGVRTVRESFSLHEIVDKGNWSLYERIMEIAAEEGMQIIWSSNHFDMWDGADPASDDFVRTFKDAALEQARRIRKYDAGTLYMIPWNEISFSAFAMGEVGDTWGWYPYWSGRGIELKARLIAAAVAAMDAIWEVEPYPRVRFIHSDPLMYRIAANPNDLGAVVAARDFGEHKFQAWDMLSGRLCPELGGSDRHLDIVGVNYYYRNQERGIRNPDVPGGYLWWGMDMGSPFRVSFADLLQETHARYGKPIYVSETGSHGWLRDAFTPRTIDEIEDARLNRGIPVVGVCAFPIIDYPEWFHDRPTNSGLWDFRAGDPSCERIPHGRSVRLFKRYARKTRRP